MTDDDHPTYNGRYEVQRRIARGGMADVLLARDLLLARPVAVKVLFPEFASDPSFVARFRREAQAAANLNHPNIVGVYDWGQEGGTYYIVMEFIDGRSLSEILRTQGTPPAKTAAGVAADVANALGFAHRNGVVHRDIKPGNIMITNGGHVKVADFGIARAITASAEENLTQTGSVMGTATYFSPEQAQGHNVEGRSDLYSLGIVMYEMAHGKPPFVADSPIAVAYKHVQEKPEPLRDQHPDVPVGYEAIAMRLLAKAPDDRYPDAEALRADLRRFTEGLTVRATAPSKTTAGVAAAGATAATPSAAAAGPPAPPTRSGPIVAGDPEPQDDQDRRSRTGWFLLLLVAVLALLGGALFLLASMVSTDDETEGIVVPDVTDRPVQEAQLVLIAAGFEVDTTTREASAEVPRDEVISQDPDGGDSAEEGTTVRLVVSTGPAAAETEEVPDIEGRSEDDAIRALADDGFEARRIERVESADVPLGVVVSQNPAGGEEVPVDTPIEVVVSTGPPPTTRPPITAPPTTDPPVTAPPTTDPPITAPPTTEPPTTEAPTTESTSTTSSTSSTSSP